MKLFKADLHIHTVLSPCGSLEMAPDKIVMTALEKKLDIIAITDHNSTLQCRSVMEAGAEYGLFVIGGAEVNTREEVHCLTFFENLEALDDFQDYLDKWLPNILNNPEKFGNQVWVNRKEVILGEEKRLLWAGINQSIEEVSEKVNSLGGIFIPAHINRRVNGIISQLGFIPHGLNIDAVEINGIADRQFLKNSGIGSKYRVISGSDSHFLHQIGSGFTWLKMEEVSFKEFRMALKGVNNRNATSGWDDSKSDN